MRIGAERLAADPTLVQGERIGLITNPTGVLPDLTPTAQALTAAGLPLAVLLGPEHGLRGTAQAGFTEQDSTDPVTGLPVLETYEADPVEVLERSGADTLIFDIADIGTRFYTFIWTMYDYLAAARKLGVRFVVLDRPNPLGGEIAEGPLLDPAYASPVGKAPIPIRHGLTAGELALSFDPSVQVIEMDGWRRDMDFAATGLPWIMPSVNMPTPDTALVYPGTGLLEGTNLSEGRGTTRPFELIGAPYLDERFLPALRELELPGVRFREAWFTPTFHKHAGVPVRGVQLHVTDAAAFRPVLTGVWVLHLARTLYPDDFAWWGPDRFEEHLWGSGTLTGAPRDPRELCPDPSHPVGHLLYPSSRR
ncbi:exo-beta-N-acetylmuramidase NamZ domain-containing protein [Nonomuraea sp. NPDC050328]|uniref:exo-beta-N-acetylmuramidase NamZ family protein n=1 Tax=Nonomuraea sp. NPDC050328 TaxID=3364361 RepID=UPI00378DFA8A